MAIGKTWAGQAYGTNTGKLFLSLEGEDDALRGRLRFNDDAHGIFAIDVEGRFEESKLFLNGKLDQPQFYLEIFLSLDSGGELKGGWTTTGGAAGTLALYPHDSFFAQNSDKTQPAQLYTSRYNFGPIVIDRKSLLLVAKEIQSEFPSSKLVVSVSGATEQVFYLDYFAEKHFPNNLAEVLTFRIQAPDRDGLTKMSSLELGPSYNIAVTQGTEESWVIGQNEKLKSLIIPFERPYFSKLKKLGINFNQIISVATVVYLPSLGFIWQRASLVIGVILIIYIVNLTNSKILNNATIYLSEKSPSNIKKFGPMLASIAIAIIGGAAATLLASYIQNLIPPN